MSDLAPERDEQGRFMKQAETAPADVDAEYHPAAKIMFGWTSSPRLPLIALFALAISLLSLIALSVTSTMTISSGLMAITGIYAGLGFMSVIVLAALSHLFRRLLRRDEDYYGEADTLPRDVEELS